MHPKYTSILQLHKEDKILKGISLFDYSQEGALVPLYDHVYETCYNHLQTKVNKTDLSEVVLAYDLEDDPTGTARPSLNAITLSRNIIRYLYDLYWMAEEVLTKNGSKNIQLAFKRRSLAIDEALIAEIAEFQYYHELGHLLQDNINPKANINSRSQDQPGDIPYLQAREIDADWMAADQLAQRIVNSFLDKGLSIDELEGDISIALTAVSCFFIRAIKHETLQYNQGNYPDPIIRIEIFRHNIFAMIKCYLPSGNTFNEQSVVDDASNFIRGMFANELTEEGLFPNTADEVKAEIIDNKTKIEEYISKLTAKSQEISENCSNGKAISIGLSKYQ